MQINSMNYFRKLWYLAAHKRKLVLKFDELLFFQLNRQLLTDALPPLNECCTNTKNAVNVLQLHLSFTLDIDIENKYIFPHLFTFP